MEVCSCIGANRHCDYHKEYSVILRYKVAGWDCGYKQRSYIEGCSGFVRGQEVQILGYSLCAHLYKELLIRGRYTKEGCGSLESARVLVRSEHTHFSVYAPEGLKSLKAGHTIVEGWGEDRKVEGVFFLALDWTPFSVAIES